MSCIGKRHRTRRKLHDDSTTSPSVSRHSHVPDGHRFHRRFLGYDRVEVEQSFTQLHVQLEECKQELAEKVSALENLQAQLEEYEMQLAVVRRERFRAAQGKVRHATPVMVMVGPVESLPSIVSLIDDVERADVLNIQFRSFRDGFYRIDGSCSSKESVANWFRERRDVVSVRLGEDTVYAIPKEKLS